MRRRRVQDQRAALLGSVLRSAVESGNGEVVQLT
jgi:hypothetical protein